MTEKAKIKVIKKDAIKPAEVNAETPVKTKREAARDVVSTVTTWVSDFQMRKRGETKAAFEKFLINQPRPSES